MAKPFPCRTALNRTGKEKMDCKPVESFGRKLSKNKLGYKHLLMSYSPADTNSGKLGSKQRPGGAKQAKRAVKGGSK